MPTARPTAIPTVLPAILPTIRRLLAAAAAVLTCVAAQADPVTLFVPFDGAGNLSVFDPVAGTGGWTGSMDPSPFPAPPWSFSLVSVVLFTLDKPALTLNGSFEFTNAADLSSTLFGAVSGSVLDADILVNGGQFSIDYTILGGTGMFSGASGYGLSFVDFDPAGSFNNYAESGQLVVTVPEPATLALAGLALLAGLAARPRRRGAASSLAVPA
jgi:hypothetical protein